MGIGGIGRALMLAGVLLVLGGCASTRDFSSVKKLDAATPAAATPAEPHVLQLVVMPPDVELSVLTAGGMTEPNAAWTQTAKSLLVDQLGGAEALRGKKLVRFEPPAAADPNGAVLNEIQHLHRAVGNAIVMHKLAVPLPTKKDRFDWSLGQEVAVLHDYARADYALFIYVRDSYSSAGRIFTQIAAAALGVGLAGGQQAGFATLVDLGTGNVVWFNFLVDATGDLRDASGAADTVKNLLHGMPQ
ncbi:MAG: hypothetical protein HY943_04930 [Gammaproteobacteria bacterium]|nr:hypothetical protein [Gammaproteobacteria bacterium]